MYYSMVILFSGFEIPDADAERLLTPADIVQYIGDKNENAVCT